MDVSKQDNGLKDDKMPESLLQIVESTTLDAAKIRHETTQIHTAVLSQSKYIDDPNFTRVHPDDLKILFAEYDGKFFDGRIREALGERRLDFDFSNRMTSAGGKTARCADSSGRLWYEIRISTAILFECFREDDHRPISASGILCRNRLHALQRIMEHEIIHLIELHLWGHSRCAQPRFQSVTRRFFGHTEYKHRLITPREKAVVQYGIVPGMRVRFRFDEAEHEGVVNRITKRATVLVEDPDGPRYSDGKHYSKFYIPVSMLEVVE